MKKLLKQLQKVTENSNNYFWHIVKYEPQLDQQAGCFATC